MRAAKPTVNGAFGLGQRHQGVGIDARAMDEAEFLASDAKAHEKGQIVAVLYDGPGLGPVEKAPQERDHRLPGLCALRPRATELMPSPAIEFTVAKSMPRPANEPRDNGFHRDLMNHVRLKLSVEPSHRRDLGDQAQGDRDVRLQSSA